MGEVSKGTPHGRGTMMNWDELGTQAIGCTGKMVVKDWE